MANLVMWYKGVGTPSANDLELIAISGARILAYDEEGILEICASPNQARLLIQELPEWEISLPDRYGIPEFGLSIEERKDVQTETLSLKHLDELKTIVRSCIEEAGGKVELSVLATLLREKRIRPPEIMAVIRNSGDLHDNGEIVWVGGDASTW